MVSLEDLREPTRAYLYLVKKFLEADWGVFTIAHRGGGKTVTVKAFERYFAARGYTAILLGGGNLLSLAEELHGEFESLYIGVPEAGSRTDYSFEKFLSIASQLITDRIIPKMHLRGGLQLYAKVRNHIAVLVPVQFKLLNRIVRNPSRHNLAQDRFIWLFVANPPNRELALHGDEAVIEAMVDSIENRKPSADTPVLKVDDLELMLQMLGLTQTRAYRLASRIGELRGEAAFLLATSAYIMNFLMPSDFLDEDSPANRIRLSQALIIDALVHDPRSIKENGEIDTRYLLLKFRSSPATISRTLDSIAENTSGLIRKERSFGVVKYYAEPILEWLAGRLPFNSPSVQEQIKLILEG